MLFCRCWYNISVYGYGLIVEACRIDLRLYLYLTIDTNRYVLDVGLLCMCLDVVASVCWYIIYIYNNLQNILLLTIGPCHTAGCVCVRPPATWRYFCSMSYRCYLIWGDLCNRTFVPRQLFVCFYKIMTHHIGLLHTYDWNFMYVCILM